MPFSPAAANAMKTNMKSYQRLEAKLYRVQRMEAIGRIASGVAHNFRNTLNEISINSQVLQMNYKDASQLQEITDRINTSVKRGALLVDGLLQFSGKQTGKEFKPLDLSEAIKGMYEIIRPCLDAKIELRVEFPCFLPIRGDLSALSQAMVNLCMNARDAMPDGGVLQIKAKKAGDKVEVIVSDTGEGMDSETVAKCFEPFFTTKPIGKGLGMGLSATYGIIKSHGGLIAVYSEAGKGTNVKIQFPLAEYDADIETGSNPRFVGDRHRLREAVDGESGMHPSYRDCPAEHGFARSVPCAVKAH
jgi:signal transduction histidine kinase